MSTGRDQVLQGWSPDHLPPAGPRASLGSPLASAKAGNGTGLAREGRRQPKPEGAVYSRSPRSPGFAFRGVSGPWSTGVQNGDLNIPKTSKSRVFNRTVTSRATPGAELSVWPPVSHVEAPQLPD